MTNLIEQFIGSNDLTVRSTKKIAFKESMEWKNIFNKAILDVFDQDIRQANDRVVNNNNDKKSSESNKVFTKNVNKMPDQQGKNNQPVDKHSNELQMPSRIDANSKNGQLVKDKIEIFNALTSTSMPIKNEQSFAKELATKNPSSMELYRAYNNYSNQSLGRIHLCKTDSGLKIYARNNRMDEASMIRMIKIVVEKFDHSKIAIEEIKLNGKIKQI